ncbi:hypothetical protein S83_004373 [Arachis hypogaea]
MTLRSCGAPSLNFLRHRHNKIVKNPLSPLLLQISPHFLVRTIAGNFFRQYFAGNFIHSPPPLIEYPLRVRATHTPGLCCDREYCVAKRVWHTGISVMS